MSERETIYRVRLDDADLDAERLDVDLVRPVAAPLVVEIEDGDSPPLAHARVTLSGMERRALVPATAAPLTLYYGNAATRRPVYDIEALRTRLSLVERYPQCALGPETANPRFTPLAPMAFLASRGAVADTSRWTVSRQLKISGGDDVYTLTLAPGDLVYLRPDLGDIRLVDSERRQVPYVLEPRAAAARVRAHGDGGDAAGRRRADVGLAADRGVRSAGRGERLGPAAGGARSLLHRRVLHAAGGAADAGSAGAARPARAARRRRCARRAASPAARPTRRRSISTTCGAPRSVSKSATATTRR